MNSSRILLIMAVAVVLAVGVVLCAQTAAGGTKLKTVIITAERNGQTVSVRSGDVVVVQLVAQPTAGYEWQLRPLNSKVVVLQGEPEVKPGTLIGAPATQLFHFKALAAGSVTLHFDYARPWEKNTPPAKTFEVTLQAE